MAANSLESKEQQKLQNKPLCIKNSSEFHLESFLQSCLPGAHGHIYHCSSWLSHIKPLYLPGTRGKEKFSILFPNIFTTSSTLGSSPTNCVSLTQKTLELLSCSSTSVFHTSATIVQHFSLKEQCLLEFRLRAHSTTANNFLLQQVCFFSLDFKEVLSLKNKIQNNGRYNSRGFFLPQQPDPALQQTIFVTFLIQWLDLLHTVLEERRLLTL